MNEVKVVITNQFARERGYFIPYDHSCMTIQEVAA